MKKPPLELLENYRATQNVSLVFGNLLVCLMMGTIAMGFIQFGTRINDTWQGGYLLWLSLLVSLEAIYTRKKTADMELRDRLIFRLSEWVALAVAIKLLLYLLRGPAQLLEDLPLWQENFLIHFFTGEYTLALLVTGIIWWSAGSFSNELEALYERSNDAQWDELGKLQNALHAMRDKIATRIFVLGILVVAMAVLSRIDDTLVLRVTGQVASGYRAPVANVLAYFILALVLLSQTQFALLRTRWLWQRMPISSKLANNWVRSGLLFFAFLAVVVFFLPTEYSIGLFDTLRLALDFVFQGLAMLFFVITLPLTLCMSLFSLFSAPNGETAPMPPAAPPPAPPVAAEPAAWLDVLRSLAFWLLFIGIIFFALRYYLIQNKALWNIITRFPLARWLSRAWASARSWLGKTNRQVTRLVRGGLQRLRARGAGLPAVHLRRPVNLSRLSPREKIIYFYLNLVEMASQHGLERKPSQTPYQYESQLKSALPDVDEDVHNLTDTFLEARYSRHTVEDPQARQAQSLWEHIREVLRGKKK
jgi:hypothetical protein